MLSEKVIPPNGEGQIKVTYSAGKRRGSQSKPIYVSSNDPDQPKLTLKVKGLVKEAVVCTPNRLNFGKVIQGESRTKQIAVSPGEGEKMTVKSVEVSSEYLTADFSKSTEGEKESYLINVTLSPEAPRGRLNKQVKIHTDNEHAPLVTVSVMATITGEIVTTPDRVSLIIQKGEQNPGSAVSINKARGGPFTISKIECNLEYITTTLQPVEEGKRYKVEVNATADAPIGRATGTITIHTDDPKDPEIGVPLTVTVRGNLRVIPERLSFGLVNQGRVTTKTIALTTRKEQLKIKKVESSADFLITEVVTKEPGKRFQINVSVDPKAPVGSIKGTITIHTNDPLQPEVEVPVTGRVRTPRTT